MDGEFGQAVRLQQAGDLGSARIIAERLASRAPGNLDYLRLAGTLACQQGDMERGTILLSRALEIAPGDENSRVNLVQALLQRGEWAAADRIAAAAPRPTADLLLLQAMSARHRGKPDLARRLLKGVLTGRPDDVIALNNLGNVEMDEGRFDAAVEAFERAARQRPDDMAIQLNLARARFGAGDETGARQALESATRRRSDDPAFLFALAETLTKAGLWAEALPVLGSAARLDRANPALFTLLGVTFEHLEEREQAEQAYRFAVNADPTHAPALLNLGIVFESGNKLDELRKLLAVMDAGDVAPRERAYLHTLLLRREGRIDEALARLDDSEGPSAIDEGMRHHLRGQLADRMGDAASAFRSFAAMHEAVARGSGYSGEEGWRDVAHETADLARRLESGWPEVPVDPGRRTPAFLIGFMRSGTTLVDTMLMGHSDTLVLEERPILSALAREIGSPAAAADLDARQVAAMRASYFSSVDALDDKAREALIVDKFPMATLHVAAIHRIFPDAPIIFALRHPCDVILSCFMQNFRLSPTMASFLTIENAARYYDAVMTRWWLARERLPLNVHVLRYEALIETPEVELRRVSEFLGLAFEETMLDHQRTARERGYIRTPSYHQVTEGLYRGSSDRWRRYEGDMAPALPILAPWAERFGYPPLGSDLSPR